MKAPHKWAQPVYKQLIQGGLKCVIKSYHSGYFAWQNLVWVYITTGLYRILVFHEHTNTWVMRFSLRLVHLVSYSGRSCSCCCSSSKSTRSHSYSRRACRLFQNSRNSVTAETYQHHTNLFQINWIKFLLRILPGLQRQFSLKFCLLLWQLIKCGVKQLILDLKILTKGFLTCPLNSEKLAVSSYFHSWSQGNKQ